MQTLFHINMIKFQYWYWPSSSLFRVLDYQYQHYQYEERFQYLFIALPMNGQLCYEKPLFH